MAVGGPISNPTFQHILPRRATHHPFTAPIYRSQQRSIPRASHTSAVRSFLLQRQGVDLRTTRAVAWPSPSSLFLCIPVNKGNHFLIWTFGPRKPLFAACIISYWSFLATPLFDIIGLTCLHPFGVRVLLACVFRCFKPYRMLSVLLRPIFSIYLASSILLCLSIVCPIQLHGQLCLRRHLPLRPSLRPTTQSKAEKRLPFLRFFHRSITTLFSTLVSLPSQLCHTLFQPPTATHSVPKSRISISTRQLSPFTHSRIQEIPNTIQNASLQLLQAAPRASPECGEECGQPSSAQGEEETLNPDCKTSPASQLSFLSSWDDTDSTVVRALRIQARHDQHKRSE